MSVNTRICDVSVQNCEGTTATRIRIMVMTCSLHTCSITNDKIQQQFIVVVKASVIFYIEVK